MGLVGLPAIAFCREKTLRDTELRSPVFPVFAIFLRENAI